MNFILKLWLFLLVSVFAYGVMTAVSKDFPEAQYAIFSSAIVLLSYVIYLIYKNFSLFKKAALRWFPILFIYLVIPAILLDLVGYWVFMVYPLWIIWSYKKMEYNCSQRDSVNFIGRGDMIEFMFFVMLPSIISAVVMLMLLAIIINTS